MALQEKQKLTLRQAHKLFLDELKKKGRAHATILAYGKDLEQLIILLDQKARKQPSQVETEDIKEFKLDLQEKKYTPKSISRKINSIKSFFKFLHEEGIIEGNPAQGVSHPKYELKPPRILTKMEYRALRDVCREDQRLSAIIELLLQTGIRIGELAALTIDNIKKDKMTIEPYGSHPGREVNLNKAGQKAINAYLKRRPKSRYRHLFLTKTGRPFLVRNIRTAINRYFKLADIKEATVNDLRHTFIAHQLKAGTPLILVSKMVGHKRLSTTENYLKYIEKEEEEKVKLEEL